MTYTEQRIAATRKRVQIPAYTDRWMMGDRYGCVMKVTRTRKQNGSLPAETEIAIVLLDKSGKTVRVLLADCTEV
jgi:hypothetical protein